MANVPNDQEVLGGIREELAAIKVPGAEEAAPESTWSDLDVDSLDLVEVVKALEDRYEIQIADGRLKSSPVAASSRRSVRAPISSSTRSSRRTPASPTASVRPRSSTPRSR
jgi:acyl carrier protein